MSRKPYVPALGWHVLTRLYDPLLRLTMPEQQFKHRLIAQASLEPGYRILDLGCGTGTLMLLVRSAHPAAKILGLDRDYTILLRAASKARREHAPLAMVTGTAEALPFAAGSFDRVLTTLTLHHLNRDSKRLALREIWRVLRPSGELHIADWGRPHTRAMRVAAFAVAAFDGRETVADNVAGRIPDLCREAGFGVGAAEEERWRTVFGTLSFYRAVKPGR